MRNLEIRVEDLQLQLQQMEPETEHFELHTPRNDQNAPDMLHDWYAGSNAQVQPPETGSLLPDHSRPVTLDPNLTDNQGAANQNLQESARVPEPRVSSTRCHCECIPG